MKKKKFLVLLLTFIMVFALAACGGDKDDDDDKKASSKASPDGKWLYTFNAEEAMEENYGIALDFNIYLYFEFDEDDKTCEMSMELDRDELIDAMIKYLMEEEDYSRSEAKEEANDSIDDFIDQFEFSETGVYKTKGNKLYIAGDEDTLDDLDDDYMEFKVDSKKLTLDSPNGEDSIEGMIPLPLVFEKVK